MMVGRMIRHVSRVAFSEKCPIWADFTLGHFALAGNFIPRASPLDSQIYCYLHDFLLVLATGTDSA